MHGCRISALGLVTFAVVVHAGCDAPTCPPGATGPVDNRGRKAYPNNDSDWVCMHLPPEIPVPDLGGENPVDPPGPKDMDAVARAAVFVESCVSDVLFSDGNINARIDNTYSTVPWSVEHAISQRVNCFRDKSNGCDAVRECLGIVITSNLFKYWQGCDDGVGMRRVGVAPEPVSNYWINCAGLGLECYPEDPARCSFPREECDFEVNNSYCSDDDARRNCRFYLAEENYFRYLSPSCTDYGLMCTTETLGNGAMCTGSGATCDAWQDDFVADFGVGIGCDDSATLRACVNGHEQIVDCSRIAMGFQCIGGSRPHCGADFQCNYDRANERSTCNGNLLEVCNGGLRMTLDCSTLGFDGCDPVRGVCKPKPIVSP